MRTGLVSVTFRSQDRRGVVDLTREAGLSEIEWGGDIHVPHGDIRAAEDAKALSCDAGIVCASYGSYYKLPVTGDGFDDVLDTASALGASSVRIWAGTSGARDTDVMTRAAMTETLRRNADAAAERGMELSFEYHGGTLTDSADSAIWLLHDCGRENVRLHWQPNQFEDLDYNLRALRRVAEYVDIVHVFSWEGEKWFPLAKHEDAWRRYFDVLFELGNPRSALLEFLPCECRDDLLRDAETLNKWVG